MFVIFSSLLALGCGMAGTLSVYQMPVNTYMGHAVGPAGATLDGMAVDWTCDDFTSVTYVPSGDIQVDVSTFPALTNARFVNLSLVGYEEMALLVSQMAGNPGLIGLLGGATSIGDLQLAVWQISDPGDPNLPVTAGLIQLLNWVSGQNLSAWDFSGVRIVTPIGASISNQEGIIGTAVPIPEPISLALVGSGLIGVGWILHRRNRRQRLRFSTR